MFHWVIPENIHTTPTEEINPPTPSDVLIHLLLLSETICSPLPLRTAEISSVGEYGSFLERPIVMEGTHFCKNIPSHTLLRDAAHVSTA